MNLASKIADKVMGSAPTSTASQPKYDPVVKMNALVWNGKKTIDYVKKPKPLITEPTDAIIRVTATTICGSDLHLYTNAMLDMHEGDILGHEFMGIIEDVGSEVTKTKPGDRVVASFGIACGKCEYCQKKQFTACDTTNPSKLVESMYGHRPAALFGYSHLTGGIPGGQSEYVRVPFADMNLLHLPNEVPDVKALYLSDIIPTAFHGTELAEVKKGDKVAIWGLGPIGILTARWCQIREASQIIGIDCVPERIAVARRLGIQVLNFKEVKITEELPKLCPGGVDASIECAGFEYASTILHKVERALQLETDTADILSEMIYVTKKFGIISIIGVYSGYCNHFPIGAMMEKDLIVKGGQSPTQKYWEMCLMKLKNGDFDAILKEIVYTEKGKLSDGPELYKTFYDKSKGCIKVFLRPDNLDPKDAM